MPQTIDSSIKFFGNSFSGTASKNTTTNIDYLVDGQKALFGAELIQQNAVFGDKISLSVIDKDNVLGFGANTVLNQWIDGWFVNPDSSGWRVKSDVAGTIPSGCYIRVTYDSTGTTTDVLLYLNLWWTIY